MLSNHLILCHPLLFLPSVFPNIRIFSNESTLRTMAVIAPTRELPALSTSSAVGSEWSPFPDEKAEESQEGLTQGHLVILRQRT